VSRDELTGIASAPLAQTACTHITLTKAYVNSFEQTDGTIRHDVLIGAEEPVAVEALRSAHFRTRSDASNFNMQPVHVTHSTSHESAGAAERVARDLNASLPRSVMITGVTID